jgi:translation initiation factor IF-3
MAGRNINMQMTPLPEKQRVRKFANFKHGRFIDPEEEDNTHEHEDDHHHDGHEHDHKADEAHVTAEAEPVTAGHNGSAIPVE